MKRDFFSRWVFSGAYKKIPCLKASLDAFYGSLISPFSTKLLDHTEKIVPEGRLDGLLD